MDNGQNEYKLFCVIIMHSCDIHHICSVVKKPFLFTGPYNAWKDSRLSFYDLYAYQGVIYHSDSSVCIIDLILPYRAQNPRYFNDLARVLTVLNREFYMLLSFISLLSDSLTLGKLLVKLVSFYGVLFSFSEEQFGVFRV